MSSCMVRRQATTRGRWLRVLRASPYGRRRVFCFHHAGGNAAAFGGFAEHFAAAPDCEVVAVQLPGRAERRSEPLIDALDLLAGRIAGEIRRHADRPYALLGVSMGGALAYEVARKLEADGPAGGPSALFVCSAGSPKARGPRLMHALPADALVRAVRCLGGIPPELDRPDLLALTLPVLRADLRAVETHRHDELERLRCPTVVVVGDRDPLLSPAAARSWTEVADVSDVMELPGGHFVLDEGGAAVAEAVLRRLPAQPPLMIGTQP